MTLARLNSRDSRKKSRSPKSCGKRRLKNNSGRRAQGILSGSTAWATRKTLVAPGVPNGMPATITRRSSGFANPSFRAISQAISTISAKRSASGVNTLWTPPRQRQFAGGGQTRCKPQNRHRRAFSRRTQGCGSRGRKTSDHRRPQSLRRLRRGRRNRVGAGGLGRWLVALTMDRYRGSGFNPDGNAVHHIHCFDGYSPTADSADSITASTPS